MCNVVASFDGLINNNLFFLKPNYKIALHQIKFIRTISENFKQIVNVYCDCLYNNAANPFGILRTIVLEEQNGPYVYNFQENPIFFEIGVLKNHVKIYLDHDFKISFCSLVILKNES